MLQFFRRMFHSTLGIGITVALLIVIALAFAASDVASSGGFGGLTGGDRVAKVGAEKIGTAELARQATQLLDGARADNPKLTMKDFLAAGGLDAALSQLIDRTAMDRFGESHGVVAGKRLVDSELAKIPSLQGPDGKFSDSAYRQLLAQRHLTDEDVRQDIAGGLVGRALLQPATIGAVLPSSAALRYVAVLHEKRSGAVAVLPSEAFAAKAPPGDAEVAAFYAAHRDAFTRPELRVIRYAAFDEASISVPPPSEARIAARYQADQAQYAASQLRKLTQLVVADAAGAKAVAAEVAAGKSLEAAASARGLSVAAIGPVGQSALAAQSSPAIATAAFAARRGGVAGPVQGALGWYLLRVDAVDDRAARSLAEAQGEIATALTAEDRRAALGTMTQRIEDGFDKGGALADAAKLIGVAPQETAPLTSTGQPLGAGGPTPNAGAMLPTALAKLLPTAFQMNEAQPQLAEIVPGKQFALFDVTRIVSAAPPPLAEIRTQVAAALVLQHGAAAAGTAARQVLAAAQHGTSLAAAVAALHLALPAVQPLALSREQIAAMKGQVPAPVSLLFAMAPGTAKLLPLPGNRGWLVVRLDSVDTPPVAPGDPMIAEAQRGLGQLTGREYSEELRAAIRREVGVTRNPAGIDAVRRQLAGGG